jgi:predicted dehydrogenase
MPNRRLRGALIGAGSIAQYHLAAWHQISDVEIVAISNRTTARADELALRFGIGTDHIHPSTAALLAAEQQLDFVDIVTAPDLHRSDVEQSAAAGVAHILCQKPLAPTMDDALAMRDAVKFHGATLTTNENWRWRSWYRQLKDVLDSKRLGEPRYARIAAHHNVALGHPGAPPPILQRQSYTASMSHFLVMEWGVHLIDTLRMLLGEPQWVHATMSQASPYFQGEDRAVISLGFGGIIASIDISWATHASPSPPTLLEETTIEGDAGTISLIPNRGDGDLIRLVEALPLEALPIDRERPWSPVAVTSTPAHDGNIAAAYQASFTAAHRHYVQSWLANQLPETHIDDNLRTMEVMFAAYRSAESNAVIRLEGAPISDESS